MDIEDKILKALERKEDLFRKHKTVQRNRQLPSSKGKNRPRNPEDAHFPKQSASLQLHPFLTEQQFGSSSNSLTKLNVSEGETVSIIKGKFSKKNESNSSPTCESLFHTESSHLYSKANKEKFSSLQTTSIFNESKHEFDQNDCLDFTKNETDILYNSKTKAVKSFSKSDSKESDSESKSGSLISSKVVPSLRLKKKSTGRLGKNPSATESETLSQKCPMRFTPKCLRNSNNNTDSQHSVSNSYLSSSGIYKTDDDQNEPIVLSSTDTNLKIKKTFVKQKPISSVDTSKFQSHINSKIQNSPLNIKNIKHLSTPNKDIFKAEDESSEEDVIMPTQACVKSNKLSSAKNLNKNVVLESDHINQTKLQSSKTSFTDKVCSFDNLSIPTVPENVKSSDNLVSVTHIFQKCNIKDGSIQTDSNELKNDKQDSIKLSLKFVTNNVNSSTSNDVLNGPIEKPLNVSKSNDSIDILENQAYTVADASSEFSESPTIIPDTELPDSENVYSDFTELDAIPYSQFELSEDFLSGKCMDYIASRKSNKNIALVKRRSPRISLRSYSNSSNSSSQSRSPPSQSCNVLSKTVKLKNKKIKKSILSFFHDLINLIELDEFVEFELPDHIKISRSISQKITALESSPHPSDIANESMDFDLKVDAEQNQAMHNYKFNAKEEKTHNDPKIICDIDIEKPQTNEDQKYHKSQCSFDHEVISPGSLFLAERLSNSDANEQFNSDICKKTIKTSEEVSHSKSISDLVSTPRRKFSKLPRSLTLNRKLFHRSIYKFQSNTKNLAKDRKIVENLAHNYDAHSETNTERSKLNKCEVSKSYCSNQDDNETSQLNLNEFLEPNISLTPKIIKSMSKTSPMDQPNLILEDNKSLSSPAFLNRSPSYSELSTTNHLMTPKTPITPINCSSIKKVKTFSKSLISFTSTPKTLKSNNGSLNNYFDSPNLLSSSIEIIKENIINGEIDHQIPHSPDVESTSQENSKNNNHSLHQSPNNSFLVSEKKTNNSLEGKTHLAENISCDGMSPCNLKTHIHTENSPKYNKKKLSIITDQPFYSNISNVDSLQMQSNKNVDACNKHSTSIFEESYISPGQPMQMQSILPSPNNVSCSSNSSVKTSKKNDKTKNVLNSPLGLTYMWEDGSVGPRQGSFTFTPGRRLSRTGAKRKKQKISKKSLKFAGCFQSCSQDTVVKLLSGEVFLPDGKSQRYVVSVQATALTIWAEVEQDNWIAELDWALSEATHILRSCLLQSRDSVHIMTSGQNMNKPCADLFCYNWTTEKTCRLSMPLEDANSILSQPDKILLCPVSASCMMLGLTTSSHYVVQRVTIIVPGPALGDTSGPAIGDTCLSPKCKGQLLDLVLVSGHKDSPLIGLTSDQRIVIWHAFLCVELKSIRVCTSLPCLTRLLGARDNKGVLLLDVAWKTDEADFGGCIALNPISDCMIKLKTFDTPDNLWKCLEEVKSEKGFLTAVNDRGSVAVWKRKSGRLLGSVKYGHTTSAAIMNKSLILGEIYGSLHLYNQA